MAKEILGHIDCPHCGYEKGMRITLDKSGAPFGYCEANCNGQMRVGGNPARVSAFYARHSHLVAGSKSEVTENLDIAAKKQAPKKAAPVVEPAPVVVPPRKLSLFEQMAGVKA